MGEVLAMRKDGQEEPVLVEQAGGVVHLTLANPPANALSLEVMAALQSELDRAADDTTARVIVIAGSGKLFCAGHDLKQMSSHRTDADGGRAFFDKTFGACSALMQSIVRHPLPVIAEINGIATAAGCQLVASCDLAICTDSSSFGVNGIDVGLFCHTPAVALLRGVKPKHAMEMLLTGEMVDASTAREFGLVNRIVPKEYLTQVVMRYAEVIAAKSPTAVKMGKKAFYEQNEMNMADAYEHASRVIIDNMMAADACEGIDAFFKKRKPVWEG